MKLLLTGATGFFGSHLVKTFLTQGHELTILKRSFSPAFRIGNLLKHIKSYNIDQCDLERPFKENGKYDAVIHTATCYGRNGESAETIFNTNTEFPRRLLQIASNFDTDTFLNTDTFFNTDTIRSNYLNSYVLSKKEFVEWGKKAAARNEIRFINAKLEHIYGPLDDESKFTTHIINACLANIPELRLTLGEQKRDFIYVDDVVMAYKILLDKTFALDRCFQEYEIGTGHSVSIREFVEMVHSLTESKTHLNFGALPYRENEIMESHANIKRLTDLLWQPVTSLENGIKRIMSKGSSYE